jgi:hypothetical protein
MNLISNTQQKKKREKEKGKKGRKNGHTERERVNV